jgi:hypothetical protein
MVVGFLNILNTKRTKHRCLRGRGLGSLGAKPPWAGLGLGPPCGTVPLILILKFITTKGSELS